MGACAGVGRWTKGAGAGRESGVPGGEGTRWGVCGRGGGILSDTQKQFHYMCPKAITVDFLMISTHLSQSFKTILCFFF